MTSFFTALILMAYTAISVSGLTFLKLSDGNIFTTRGIAGGILYCIGFLVWYGILTRLPLSVAFPIAASSLVLGTQVAGYFFLREPLGMLHISGLLCIIVGIGIVMMAGGQT
jgi:multidrug transporter EmrE-like cation transporter